MTDKKTEALKMALKDRPVDIELAQYKRLFEAACSALGQIGDALGCDPEEGGVEPILVAIEELKAEQPAQQKEAAVWRELCRRLYIELYWCDRQMMETLDEDGEPRWTQGKEVRDVLADAKAALETSPPASKPWVGLSEEDRLDIWSRSASIDGAINATEAKLREKNA